MLPVLPDAAIPGSNILDEQDGSLIYSYPCNSYGTPPFSRTHFDSLIYFEYHSEPTVALTFAGSDRQYTIDPLDFNLGTADSHGNCVGAVFLADNEGPDNECKRLRCLGQART